MSILIVGDIQADYENLSLCKKVADQICRVAEKENVEASVFVGDLKNRYNPIDIRVLNFIVDFVHRLPGAAILLGNHDRVGLYTDTESWLPVIKHAGAQVFDHMGVLKLERTNVYMLPYRSKPKRTVQLADKLHELSQKSSKQKVLCFHAGVKESKYNESFSSKDTLSIDDLHPEAYDLVLGGHIHLRQRVKYPHVKYVGSIFQNDWSEANQVKGFHIIED